MTRTTPKPRRSLTDAGRRRADVEEDGHDGIDLAGAAVERSQREQVVGEVEQDDSHQDRGDDVRVIAVPADDAGGCSPIETGPAFGPPKTDVAAPSLHRSPLCHGCSRWVEYPSGLKRSGICTSAPGC